ncbi:uncharacterized protein PV09_07484 [Verruconis gallopava]|uniref:Uncharacterized protein n=1 Tax=Verruconis gallopava TaxID=253628 RepID=A0A0D1YJA8_9PEZI|nr:uncharacterized protein PV09_07484 [Verruconis gallopava]KIW00962.1 hypothetical protein PV09_07484 [Verruconis gallopava]
MSSSQSDDTSSPHTTSSIVAQNERAEPPDSQPQGPPVRRPSFEKLDPVEVAKALQIAELLKDTKQQPKPKETSPKKPTPPKPEFIPRPPPVPFSGNSNPDAVALRATTDLLQLQKARAAENIQRLEQLKELNRKDPKEFLRQLMAGNLKASSGEKDGILGPTVGLEVEKLLAALEVGSKKLEPDQPLSSSREKLEEGAKQEFPRFPMPQNIVRTPAINWAKYGIVGDTLDKMHEEQRTNPTLGEPERLATRSSQPTTPVVESDQILEKGPEPKAPRFVMAAPYDPLKDQLKKGGRKPW